MPSLKWNMVNLSQCIFLSCVFLMFYPRRSYAYRLKCDHAVSTYNKMKRIGSKPILEDAEPGFDLTDDEITKFKLWPQGIIPYFTDNYSFDEVTRGKIRRFLEDVNVETGLNFLELNGPPNDDQIRWVFFVNRRSQLDCDDISIKQFSNDGVQRVVLGYDCINGRGIAEIVLALAGVPAQHNAPDRDYFVVVQPENIIPDKKHLFEALKHNEWLFYDTEYDFSSAGHYDFHKYTVNGKSTIKPVRSVTVPFEESQGLSYTDVWKIRMLYNYILHKNKKPKVNVTGCSRLIKPGTNFHEYRPESRDKITPRRKPNKYFGLPNDEPEFLSELRENKQICSVSAFRCGKKNQTLEESKQITVPLERYYTNHKRRSKRRKTTRVDLLKLKSDYETKERK